MQEVHRKVSDFLMKIFAQTVDGNYAFWENFREVKNFVVYSKNKRLKWFSNEFEEMREFKRHSWGYQKIQLKSIVHKNNNNNNLDFSNSSKDCTLQNSDDKFESFISLVHIKRNCFSSLFFSSGFSLHRLVFVTQSK